MDLKSNYDSTTNELSFLFDNIVRSEKGEHLELGAHSQGATNNLYE